MVTVETASGKQITLTHDHLLLADGNYIFSEQASQSK